MSYLKKGATKPQRDLNGLSPFHRPVMQGILEQAVSATIKQLDISDEQRDQHRALRSLIRMSARIGIFMGYDLQEHIELVTELWLKCKADIEAGKLKLPPGVTPQKNAAAIVKKFHESVLSEPESKAKALPKASK
jgi:hypothetical protein